MIIDFDADHCKKKDEDLRAMPNRALTGILVQKHQLQKGCLWTGLIVSSLLAELTNTSGILSHQIDWLSPVEPLMKDHPDERPSRFQDHFFFIFFFFF